MPTQLDKQPSEERVYDMDFSPRLAALEVITGITSVQQFKWDEDAHEWEATDDLDLGTPTHDSGKIAQVRIGAGVDGAVYKVTFLAQTSAAAAVVEADGLLYVVDI